MNNNTIATKEDSGIYLIINAVNGKKYVGQSISVKRRKNEHLRSLKSGTHYNSYFQNSFNKYGADAFIFKVLEYCSKDSLTDRESYWIDTFNSADKSCGYNLMKVGHSVVHSKESRLKMSVTRKERIASGEIKMKSVEWTPETRRKVLDGLKLYYSNEEVRLNLSLSTSSMDLQTIKEIKTTLKENLDLTSEDIAKKFDVSINSIRHMISGASHSLILSEYNEVIKNREVILDKRLDRSVIRLYRLAYSYSEIGKIIGVHHRNVIRRVNRLATEHDDRCRLNSYNYLIRRKKRLVLTLTKMGNDTVQVSYKLSISRGSISKCMAGESFNDVSDVKDMRGVVAPFRRHGLGGDANHVDTRTNKSFLRFSGVAQEEKSNQRKR